MNVKNKNGQMYIACLFVVAGILIVFGIIFFANLRERRSEVIESIDKGIDFLYAGQASDGEFNVHDECEKNDVSQCSSRSSIFGTTFVLYSIGGIKNEKIQKMMNAGMDFLQDKKIAGGIWSYYSDKSVMPDLDDTAMAAYILKKNGREVEDNVEIFEKNINEDKVFNTWIAVKAFAGLNDVDCGTNANILMYLQRNDQNVCDYINREIRAGRNCTLYYPDNLALYYIVSRAADEGIECLEGSKEKIIHDVLQLQKADGSFGNDVQNSFAVNTLMNFSYNGEPLQKGIEMIIKKQSQDGSWEKGAAWASRDNKSFFGSSELTTALSVEALRKYIGM